MKAKDVMVSPVVTISEEASLEEAARRMLENHIGSLLVVDREGRLVGIVTETDFLKERGIPFSTFRAPLLLGRFLDGDGLERVFQEARSTRVSEIMTHPVHAVRPEAPLREVLDLMLTYDINHVPVVDEEGRPVGIISRFDLLRPLMEKLA
ncbi:CBS domain-containing protein [Thermus filiformis]|uniref:Signal transduction protein n=1 Tax=Thermus filiformis TaxID=276 RepID=A0A0A2WM22_THEFI|nr:CBS domain-containing protein [Thermus filiformis]KGQ20868.1 signal transduction protein [Thermus filiformis]